MKKIILPIYVFLWQLVSLNAQITFIRSYGGSNVENGNYVQQTSDGGFIVAGSTNSYGYGNTDIYLIKTNDNGDTLWTKSFGGSDDDGAGSIQQTTDGGYIITGSTNSFGYGDNDVFLIKTNAYGDTSWTKYFGGINSDIGKSVQQTTDGGFIICGTTWSVIADTAYIYCIRLDASGNLVWQYGYGMSGYEFYGSSIKQTFDGGFIIAGYVYYFGQFYQEWDYDAFIMKINNNGVVQWSKYAGQPTQQYTSTKYDFGYDVIQKSDGSFVMVGETSSYGSFGNFGTKNILLVKYDATGNEEWIKGIGSSYDDGGFSLLETNAGNLIITGYSYGLGDSQRRVYLVKTNSAGDFVWARWFAEDFSSDEGRCVQQTSDGGYIIAGNHGISPYSTDIYLIKVDGDGILSTVSLKEMSADSLMKISIFPNPNDGNFIVEIENTPSEEISITVENIFGEKIYSIMEGAHGKYRQRISVHNVHNGIYIVNLKIGNEIWRKRLVIQE